MGSRRAIPAHVTSSTAGAPWDCPSLANGVVTPIDTSSPRDRRARAPGGPRPTTARSRGTTCHALTRSRAKTRTSGSIIQSFTLAIFGVTGAWCAWWIAAPSAGPCGSAPIPAWRRRPWIVETKRVSRSPSFSEMPNRVRLGMSVKRARAKLHFHCKASMSALTLGQLATRQQSGKALAGFSMARVKRRAFNQPLRARISRH